MTPEQQDLGLGVFRAAQRLEQGLQFLYERLFATNGVSFEAFVGPVRGDSLGVNSAVFEELEQIITDPDPDALLAMGDAYYHAVLKVAYALSMMSIHFAMAGRYTWAWERVAAGTAWMGFLNGRMRRLWEEGALKSEAGVRLNDIIHKEDRSSREEAMEWYDAHRAEFKNDEDRALEITKLVPYEIGTVLKWIKKHRKTKK
ncbi:hypothetical protein [Variovorax sp. DXTD-1]|uniref:hypothetical protein n=1 Tax=Variovorax sp. DXTD-1 TaxID=2495592 RepID=UPI000F86A3BF|nr:hypothetical protein [Variovorax sp. DXTD-1]RST51585.1 hypothetical protein EJI00_08405 [Variovorax sp. DXTD-1]